ncbi:hypothetical protein GW758_02520 [Candidatus Falkowbacteria bacterium]|nr:hypothetical protein [Candidatus Falkowbacteria bacterium]NCT54806.1 hypothetical protein [Candidatus Falkowbacteria bacterium]
MNNLVLVILSQTVFMSSVGNFIITMLGGVLVLVFVVFYSTKKPSSFLGRIFAFFLLGKEKQKPKLPEEQGYEQDRFDRNLFYSLAYNRLRLREIYSKNKDKMLVTTSYPHLFSEEQLREFYDIMPGISAIKVVSKHDIMIVKSAAASYRDFNDQLRQTVIEQLNKNYIPEFQKDVKKNYILRLLPESEGLCLKALSGDRIIKTHIDPEFKNLAVDKPGVITPITPVRVDELMVDSCFFDIFQSLPGTWNDKKMTQDQVVEFCMILPDWLRADRHNIFFLVPINEQKTVDGKNPEENLEVLKLCVHEKGFGFTDYRLDYALFWDAKNHLLVVSPRLKE